MLLVHWKHTEEEDSRDKEWFVPLWNYSIVKEIPQEPLQLCLLTLFHRATKQRIRLINYVKHIQLKLRVQRYRENTNIQWKMVNDMKSTTKREDPLAPQLLLSDKNLWRRCFGVIPRKYEIWLEFRKSETERSAKSALWRPGAPCNKCLVQRAKWLALPATLIGGEQQEFWAELGNNCVYYCSSWFC